VRRYRGSNRIALTDLLTRFKDFELANGDKGWTPRQALNVHGPATLPLRFTTTGSLTRAAR